MTLNQQWLNRLSTQRAAELTNPDSSQQQAPVPTTVNTARLQQAVTDVQGELLQRTGFTYNEMPVGPNGEMPIVTACIQGVTAYLLDYRGLPGSGDSKRAWDKWQNALAMLPTFLAAGTSQLQPTADCGVPDFDRSRFGDIVQQAPGANPPYQQPLEPPGVFS